MKMERKVWLPVALISVVIVVAIQPLSFLAYEEFYVKPTMSKLPPAVRPWSDPIPFYHTWYGGVPFKVYVVVGFLWLSVALLKLTRWVGREKRRYVKPKVNPLEACHA